MLCDHILFWAQHRARPVIMPGSYDEAIFNLAVSMSIAFRAAAIQLLRAFAEMLTKIHEAEGKAGLDRYLEKIKNGA